VRIFFFLFSRVYCLIGDGESAEGSIWEALHFASYYKLDNLCVIFDVNRLGQSEPTSLQHNMDVYWKRLDAFGCNAIVVDGHSVEELCKVFYVHACIHCIREVPWSTVNATISVTQNQFDM
jgi:transketolase N-terminal domain/subunit